MIRFALLASVAFVLAAPAADPPKPAVEVRLAPVADLGPAVGYVFTILGQEETGKNVVGVLKSLADAPELAFGLDLKQPVGAYAVLADKVEESTVVLMLPVTDEKAFLAALKDKANLDVKQDAKSGTYSFDLPKFTTVFLRFADGYAYLTLRSADGIGKGLLITPKVFFAGNPDGLLTADVFFDRIPADLRKGVYGQLELQLKEKAKGEQHAANKLLQEFIIDVGVGTVKTLLTDGDHLHLSLNLDPKADDVRLTATLTPKKDTTLAKTLASWADRDSRPATVSATHPLLAVGLNFALPPETAKRLATLTDDLRQETNDDGQKMLLDALTPTLKAGDLRAKVVLASDAKGKVAVSGAAVVADGKEIEKTAKAILANLQPNQGEFTPDADTAGFHKLKLADSPLASDTLWIHTAEDLLAVDTGEKADGVKATATAKAPKAPMLSAEVSVVKFLALTQGLAADTVTNLTNSVFEGGKADGLDTLKLIAIGGKQLTLTATIKGKAVAFLVALEKAK